MGIIINNNIHDALEKRERRAKISSLTPNVIIFQRDDITRDTIHLQVPLSRRHKMEKFALLSFSLCQCQSLCNQQSGRVKQIVKSHGKLPILPQIGCTSSSTRRMRMNNNILCKNVSVWKLISTFCVICKFFLCLRNQCHSSCESTDFSLT